MNSIEDIREVKNERKMEVYWSERRQQAKQAARFDEHFFMCTYISLQLILFSTSEPGSCCSSFFFSSFFALFNKESLHIYSCVYVHNLLLANPQSLLQMINRLELSSCVLCNKAEKICCRAYYPLPLWCANRSENMVCVLFWNSHYDFMVGFVRLLLLLHAI